MDSEIIWYHPSRKSEGVAHVNMKCLCFLGCIYFKPGQEDNCKINTIIEDFNKQHKIATPVCKCASFDRRQQRRGKQNDGSRKDP